MTARVTAGLRPPEPTAESKRIATRASRADYRQARRRVSALQVAAAAVEAEAGLVRVTDSACPAPDDAVQATGWWQTYHDTIGAVARQQAAVDALEADVAAAQCSHTCPVHPGPAAGRLAEARAELAHLLNSAARYGAQPRTTPKGRSPR